MPEATADDLFGQPIIIRFDGLDADRHELELSALAQSLNGLSRIVTVSSNFAVTSGRYPLRKRNRDIRVVARAPHDGCFFIDTYVQFAHHHPMFRDYSIAVAAPLTITLIAYIFARAKGNREELKLLSGALDTAIRQLGARDQPTIDRLLETIEKMSVDMHSSARRAVAPIGETARTLAIRLRDGGPVATVDEADKSAIMSPAGLTVDDERSYSVLISELDMKTGACHVALKGGSEDVRHPARITDPECSLPNNPYVLAMAAQDYLGVRAKATIRDGLIEKLFISNHDGSPRGEPDFALAN